MWTLWLAAPAFAEDEAPAEPTEECADDCGRRERKPLRHDLVGEVYVQGLRQGGAALGGGANLVQGWGFLKADARGESYQHWIGRATIGLDLFPRSRFDLTLGVFAGTVGHGGGDDVAPIEDGSEVAMDDGRWHFSPTVGTELGIGTGIGPVSFRWQHARGGGDERFSEDTVRVGFDLIRRRLTTFGQVVYFDPDSDPGAGGFGVGAALRI
jgi:hypothetical protein